MCTFPAALKVLIRNIPIFGPLAMRTARWIRGGDARPFSTSADYWEQRYKSGGSSGKGSYDLLAEFKAEVLNDFVRRYAVCSVIEFGSGDGNQLLLAKYPSYLGYDVSATAVDRCRQMFANDASKDFRLLDEYDENMADLAMSLDVVYHLVEDAVFEAYMERLFDAGRKFVVVFSSNFDSQPSQVKHVRHRHFTEWVESNRPAWRLVEYIPNVYPFDDATGEGSLADFYFYQIDAPHQ